MKNDTEKSNASALAVDVGSALKKRRPRRACRYGKNGYFGICTCPDCKPPKPAMSKINPEVPRRAMMPEWCAAERAIQNAVNEVEKIGASPRLTYVVQMLAEAREIVASVYEQNPGTAKAGHVTRACTSAEGNNGSSISPPRMNGVRLRHRPTCGLRHFFPLP